MNLFEFKQLDDNLGDDPIGDALDRLEPILGHYHTALGRLGTQEFFQKSLEDLLTEHPLDASGPALRPLIAP
jgi:hypothetical protein